jgi:hypothetical protein
MTKVKIIFTTPVEAMDNYSKILSNYLCINQHKLYSSFSGPHFELRFPFLETKLLYFFLKFLQLEYLVILLVYSCIKSRLV